MRQIKFRAKAIANYETSTDGIEKGDWVYGYYYFCRRRKSGIIVTTLGAESGGIGCGFVTVEVEVDHKTLSQFTGLLDKSMEEIYDGDIIKVYMLGAEALPIEIVGGVSFAEGSFNFMYVNKEPITIREVIKASNELGHGVEIAGNICENPELLTPPTL